MDILDEVSALLMTLNTICPSCTAEVESEVLMVDMVQFQDKLVHRTVCKQCNYSLVKTVSKDLVKDLGKRFDLTLNKDSDWKTRSVAKSRAATISIPEIGLESAQMEGVVMTVGELVEGIKEELKRSPAFQSVSAEEGMMKLMEFFQSINEVIEGDLEAHFILEDPEGMSFVETRGEDDKYLTIEK
eukprot:m.135873 g.135873  ORF g.135873 m.135873 type:complete len:186 (-) comp10271_c0_seq1:159-716(-)